MGTKQLRGATEVVRCGKTNLCCCLVPLAAAPNDGNARKEMSSSSSFPRKRSLSLRRIAGGDVSGFSGDRIGVVNNNGSDDSNGDAGGDEKSTVILRFLEGDANEEDGQEL
mmetsp:Transcript_15482/g.33421  ORF Transcript_15482/g.33421 Transcript_15482/m.33421 type:complete len:111 (-) Transcript_15482:444-776(-)